MLQAHARPARMCWESCLEADAVASRQALEDGGAHSMWRLGGITSV